MAPASRLDSPRLRGPLARAAHDRRGLRNRPPLLRRARRASLPRRLGAGVRQRRRLDLRAQCHACRGRRESLRGPCSGACLRTFSFVTTAGQSYAAPAPVFFADTNGPNPFRCYETRWCYMAMGYRYPFPFTPIGIHTTNGSIDSGAMVYYVLGFMCSHYGTYRSISDLTGTEVLLPDPVPSISSSGRLGLAFLILITPLIVIRLRHRAAGANRRTS